MTSASSFLLWFLVIAVTLVIGGFLIAKLNAKAAAEKAQMLADAAQLGMRTEVVDRDLPTYSRGNDFKGLETSSAMQFSMPRSVGSPSGDWTFLMRPPTGDDGFGVVHTLTPTGANVSASMTAILRAAGEKISNDGGILEFEAAGDTVSAFCDPDDVCDYQEILQWLPQLARL